MNAREQELLRERNPQLVVGAFKDVLLKLTPSELRLLRDTLNDRKMFKFFCDGGADDERT